MSNELSKAEVLEGVILQGDLNKLNPEQRVQYHNKVCESLGLNPLTRPFEYINMNGKLVLYAKRDATEQLRKIHKVGVVITSRESVNDVYIVTAKATTPDGRTDESIGAVPTANLKGEALANAIMKAETKAKRRVTLSICGLGMLDESEAASIPNARPLPPHGNEDVIERQLPKQIQKPETIPQVVTKAVAPVPQFDPVPEAYHFPGGKYMGKSIIEVPSEELAIYAAQTVQNLADSTFPNDKRVQATEIVKAIERYLGA